MSIPNPAFHMLRSAIIILSNQQGKIETRKNLVGGVKVSDNRNLFGFSDIKTRHVNITQTIIQSIYLFYGRLDKKSLF